MAKSKGKAHSSLHSKDNSQRLYRVEWTRNRWGSSIGKSKQFDEGDLLRPAMLDEVVPNKENYFIRPNGEGNQYYLLYQGFDKSVEYEDIKSFVKHKMIYVYNDFNVYGKQKQK